MLRLRKDGEKKYKWETSTNSRGEFAVRVPQGSNYENMRTNSVRSSYTDDTGSYRFSGLDPNADYELHAEKENEKSTTRTVSSFDSRKDIVLNLKIDKKKS